MKRVNKTKTIFTSENLISTVHCMQSEKKMLLKTSCDFIKKIAKKITKNFAQNYILSTTYNQNRLLMYYKKHMLCSIAQKERNNNN